MKRVIGMLLLLGAVSLTACKNDGPAGGMIWDIAPVCFDVYVQNAQGADLLNPATEGNILEADIRALYEGAVYERDAPVDELRSSTRAYMPRFEGLRTHQDMNGKYYLSFGEFDGMDDVENRSVVIDWGDGTQDVFAYSNNFSWKTHKPVIDRKFFLNGVRQELSSGCQRFEVWK